MILLMWFAGAISNVGHSWTHWCVSCASQGTCALVELTVTHRFMSLVS